MPGRRALKLTGRLHAWLYRGTRGKLGSRADGLDMLLLSTRGRRTGRLRTTPLPFFRDGADLILIASFGGNPRDPAWLGNLVAEPKVRVQVRDRVGEVEARVALDAERRRLWDAITTEHPRYRDYQTRTQRTIPVVILSGAASLVSR